ncbi:MAG: YggS family pyridoxal phosphate-dependent enzyme [Bryobacteraceae bacterium]
MPRENSILGARLESVESRIRQAADRRGRPRSGITLVAVSKKFSAAAIREAYQAGLREFGENYVQEFSEKRPQIGELPGACFHLIGHLQSNKACDASRLFHVVQTIDSPKLLRRLDAFAAEQSKTMEVLAEVKLSSEPNKTGASPDQIPFLLEAAAPCRHLRLTGLMAMPPWSENPEDSRPYFRQLAQLARKYGLDRLSMGMSGDFEIAIEEGATIIRVGTALFGPRPPVSARR